MTAAKRVTRTRELILSLVLGILGSGIGCTQAGSSSPAGSIPASEQVAETPKSEKEDEASHHGVRKPLPSAEEIARLPADGGEEFNRLIFEKSPYLQQHARNPVDWFAWGEEAFEKAREEKKPILLSIGYSTCHWCHVMEHESFEDEEVAALLNAHFVAIKVDREEREDVDNIYMAVCMAMNGSGGWPLNVFLTPDRKPFYAGTYFPKDDRMNRPGFLRILRGINDAWHQQNGEILASADRITNILKHQSAKSENENLDPGILETAVDSFVEHYDPTYGGFGIAPKFPAPHDYTFLLRASTRSGDDKALSMVTRSLKAMRHGGVFDHVGFGFHRYSTDRFWLLPHFEKMLYDQATLTIAYAETYAATRDEFFARVVREIATYVLRDLTSPEGGFYSAEDADSEGEEGLFYYWTEEELIEVLGEADGRLFASIFGFEEGGNFVEQATQKKLGTNILHLDRTLTEEALGRGMAAEELIAKWGDARQKLFEVRERRIHPFKDDKILTSWNGLMIAALAKAGRILGEEPFLVAARRSAEFITKNLRDDQGRLLRRYRAGEADYLGYLDDYAFLVWGWIELYEATFEIEALNRAETLTEEMLELFSGDKDEGGLFFTGHDGEALIVRKQEIYDGAIPSGNSVAAMNLLRLSRLLARPEWESRAEILLKTFASDAKRSPTGHSQLLSALDFAVGPSREIVIAGERGTAETRAMLEALDRKFDPRRVVLFRPEGEAKTLERLPAYAQAQGMVQGKTTAYLCEDFTCQLPITNPLEFALALEKALAATSPKKPSESPKKPSGDEEPPSNRGSREGE